jgi:hypothetical protein
MGVVQVQFWLEQAGFGELRAAEIRYEGYKMGRRFVVGDDN